MFRQRNPGLTPAALRTVERCRRLASASARTDPWSAWLVLALLHDDSLASACLAQLGITREWLSRGDLGSEIARAAAADAESFPDFVDGAPLQPVDQTSAHAIDDPLEFTRLLDCAAEIARRNCGEDSISSTVLLQAVLETDDFIRHRFAAAGATADKIQAHLFSEQPQTAAPLPVDEEVHFSTDFTDNGVLISVSAEQADAESIARVWRIMDANLNRAREGLRVLEDFVRFLRDDRKLSRELKALRHELVAAETTLLQAAAVRNRARPTLENRDTEGDVGTCLTAAGEEARQSVDDIRICNFRRVQESMRSLEEFGKLLSPEFAAAIKQLRYRIYTTEKMCFAEATDADAGPTTFDDAVTDTDGHTETAMLRSVVTRTAMASLNRIDRGSTAMSAVHRLQTAAVCVLVTESLCRLPWKKVVKEVLSSGADVLQLREKSLNDRELLRRAIWIRAACRDADSLLIVNDRCDLAAIVEADGVHVGQDEVPVRETRRILGAARLTGVSTHALSQILEAESEGADYLGVGPVFPSATKSFETFPGLEFVRQASMHARRPWFAIGGITLQNLDQVLSAGARRVAVTAAVVASDSPGEIVSEFKGRLRACPQSGADASLPM